MEGKGGKLFASFVRTSCLDGKEGEVGGKSVEDCREKGVCRDHEIAGDVKGKKRHCLTRGSAQRRKRGEGCYAVSMGTLFIGKGGHRQQEDSFAPQVGKGVATGACHQGETRRW